MPDQPRRMGVHTEADKQRWTDIYAQLRAQGLSVETARHKADKAMLMARKVGKHPALAAPYGKGV
jgi:hypothetical protein